MRESEENSVDRKQKIAKGTSVTLGCLAMFLLTMVVEHKQMQIPGSDLYRHVDWALRIPFWTELLPFIPYPLFHIAIKVLRYATPWNRTIVAMIVVGILNVMTYLLCMYYFLNKQRNNSCWKIIGTSIAILLFLMVQAIYVPAFNPNLYLGQGSINVWHNPTYATVRPFGIIAFMIVLVLLDKVADSKKVVFSKAWWMLLVVMIICNLAKPSFSQIFIPGLGIYMIMDIISSKGKHFVSHFQIACAFVPATILLFVQAFCSLGAGICFEWLEVWSHYTSNVLISIVLLMAFPIYVICWNVREFWEKREGRLALYIYLIGLLEAAILAEDSARKYSGNFMWGYYMGAFLLWMITMKIFIGKAEKWINGEYKKKEIIFCAVGTTLLMMHFISGMIYLYHLVFVPEFWF